MIIRGMKSLKLRKRNCKGLRNLPQHMDEKNREMLQLRLRKEKERLEAERDKWEVKLQEISERLAEIAVTEEKAFQQSGKTRTGGLSKDSQGSSSDEKEIILRY